LILTATLLPLFFIFAIDTPLRWPPLPLDFHWLRHFAFISLIAARYFHYYLLRHVWW
jgi:hypothetical protein